MNLIIRSSLALLAVAMIATFATSQQSKSDDQLLKEARRERELATQKADADFKAAREKAKAASSAEAVAILKAALADVEANSAISETRKSAMIDALKSSIRIAELSKKPGDRGTVPPATIKDDKASARLAELQKQEEERKQVQAAVKAIDKLVGQQQIQEAERKASDLADQFPNNIAAKVMGKKSFIMARIREAKDLLAEQEKRITIAMNVVTKSSMPAKGDMEFDAERFKIIARLRKTDDLTKKEKEILQALRKTIQPDWKGTQFQDIITQLSNQTGQTILIDKKALEDALIGTDSAVTFSAPREISVRTALRRVLADLGLAYVIREETIYITTTQKARDMMTTRTYYLGDLLPAGLFTSPDNMAAEEAKMVERIIGMIKKSVDPLSWDNEGGKASIHYNSIAKALIVRQSAEVHMYLRGGLTP